MKKSLVAVVIVIIFCGLLIVPLSLHPASTTLSPTSQGTSQSTPQNSLQPTPQTTSPKTEAPKPSVSLQNPPTITSQGPKQTSPQQNPPSGQQPINRTLQEAIGNATNYLAQTSEPYALLMLNIVYRQFGIPEFADSLQRYDQILTTNPENAPILRVLRRIADYNNPVQMDDFYSVTADVDKITVPALYSDRMSLPDNYESQLNDAANSGGYLLTHALLATIWFQDNHCDQPYDLTEFVYHANAGLIGTGSGVNDLEVEAAAFLYEVGQGKLVDDNFVRRVIATQNYDGGWPLSSDTPDGSNWHTSVLGLMLLLHVEFPAASYPSMIAPASTNDSACLNPLTVCYIAVWLFAFFNIRKKTMQFGLRQPNRTTVLKRFNYSCALVG